MARANLQCFLTGIDHLTRLVDAVAYLLEKFGLHERGTPA
jgi:hypothetical protein